MNKTKSGHRRIFIFVFTIPALIVYFVFFGYPILQSFYISFFRWSGLSDKKLFVGFENFQRLFQDQVVWQALRNNMIMYIFGTIFTFALAIFLATVLVKKKLKENRFYRIVFLFPNVLSIVVVSIIWSFIYSPTMGILNNTLELIGLKSLTRTWLGDENTVLGALIVPQVWMFTGFFMVLYMAGMKNIPKSLYEAARIDGASELNQFFSITIPMLWEIIRTSLVFFVARAFQSTFSLVYVTTSGGPNRASEILSTYMYEQGFVNSNFGYATVIGLLLFAVMMVINFILQKITKREVVEY
jgi:N-acetylglucosamine transport system permease protein